MKVYASFIFLCIAMLFFSGCGKENDSNTIVFATSLDYQPFEYHENGEPVGFEIELASMLAEKLGKKAVFKDMKFNAIFQAVRMDKVDAGIATISITPQRSIAFDFSDPYYSESISVISPYKINNPEDLSNLTIGAQIGSVMAIWAEEHLKKSQIVLIDNNTQAIEQLKSTALDALLLDTVQAHIFQHKNKHLFYKELAYSDYGYGILFKKNSAFREEFNKVLQDLQQNGELDRLKDKWINTKSISVRK